MALLPYLTVLIAAFGGTALSTAARCALDRGGCAAPYESSTLAAALALVGAALLALSLLAAAAAQAPRAARSLLYSIYAWLMMALVVLEVGAGTLLALQVRDQPADVHRGFIQDITSVNVELVVYAVGGLLSLQLVLVLVAAALAVLEANAEPRSPDSAVSLSPPPYSSEPPPAHQPYCLLSKWRRLE